MQSLRGSPFQNGVSMRSGVIALAVIMTGVSCLSQQSQVNSGSWTKTIEVKQIKELRVIYFPEDILTRGAVGRSQLDRWFYCLFSVRHTEFSWMDELVNALHKSNPIPYARGGDLRWGLTLFGPSNKIIGSLYVDKFGRWGDLDGKPVEISGELVRVLKRHFPTCRER